MEVKSNKYSVFLLFGIFIMIFTMVLHPSGGGFETLSKKPLLAIVSHSLAILSVPFIGIGFFGLSKILGFDKFFPKLAYSILLVGLIATIIAATLNGITQPIYAMQFVDASSETIEALKPIFAYNKALNMSFDYIILVAFILSTICWSISMIKSENLPKLIGWFGLSLCVLGVLGFLNEFSFISLLGLRIFIFTWVIWILLTCFFMSKINQKT